MCQLNMWIMIKAKAVFSCGILLIIALILTSCNTVSKYVPFETEYIEEAHCWPYNVDVYNIEGFDSKLLDGFDIEQPTKKNVMLLNWQSLATYNEGILSIPKGSCDGGLFPLRENLDGFYLAGTYKRTREVRGLLYYDFENIALIDSSLNRLYLYEYMNYHW